MFQECVLGRAIDYYTSLFGWSNFAEIGQTEGIFSGNYSNQVGLLVS